MIRSNLSILLAEQNLKITKVANDTGISRTTLTSLYYNNGQGIQFETMNKLCLYLNIDPNQLISFIPLDIKIEAVNVLGGNPAETEIFIQIIENGKKYNCQMSANVSIHLGQYNKVYSIDVDLILYLPDYDDEANKRIIEENQIILNSFSQLTRPFLNDLEVQLIDGIERELVIEHKYSILEDCNYNITWPKEILKLIK